MQRDDLIDWLDDELDTDHFNQHEDAKFNGLLVEGRPDVGTVGLCTNFTWENLESAAAQDLDLVISHHGGWTQFEGDLVQEKKEWLHDRGINWYIAHEPLDCADDYGVAAQLAKKLGVDIEGSFADHAGGENGRIGTLAVSQEEFLQRLGDIDDYDVVEPEDRSLTDIDLSDARIAVIGGGGGVFMPMLREAIEEDCDLYICGNSAFYTDIYAYERGLTLVTLEETSSERWGVYALGDKLADRFDDLQTVRLQERNW